MNNYQLGGGLHYDRVFPTTMADGKQYVSLRGVLTVLQGYE